MYKEGENSTGNLRREVWVDQVRGFAMFLVLLSHGETKVMHEMYVFLMLPLFWAISGYLHKNLPKPDWKRFFHRLIFRIGIPYVFFASLWMFEELFRTCNVDGFYSNAMDIVLGRTFWFLPCLAAIEFYSVILDFVIAWAKRKWRSGGLVIKVVVIILGILSMYVVKKNSSCPYYLDTAVTALPFFFMGSLLKDVGVPSISPRYRFLPLLGFILYLCLSRYTLQHGVLFNMSTNDNDYPIITCTIAFIGIVSSFLSFKNINFGRTLELLGKNTMLVYGINLYALCIGRFVADRIYFATDGGFVWTIIEVVIAILVCLLCSYPVNRWIPFIVGNYLRKSNKL